MLGILGGGFGLYGYLPAAVITLNEPVLLLERYKPIIYSRQELLKFKDRIIWLGSEEELLQSANSLVISRRPRDQETLVSNCLLQKNLQRIMFEKPLATSPENAQKILNEIANSNKYCSVGFNFRFTNWAIQLKRKLLNSEFSENESITINWHFMADHFKRNIDSWKMHHALGGGAIRFYGIHIIALLAELGYVDVSYSNVSNTMLNNSFHIWNACFSGSKLPNFFVNLDSKSNASHFKVTMGNEENPLFQGAGPFDPVLNDLTFSEQDARCIYLNSALQELFKSSEPYPRMIHESTKLWQLVEDQTVVL